MKGIKKIKILLILSVLFTAFFMEQGRLTASPINIYDDNKTTDNAYVYFDGVAGSDNSFKVTDYISCVGGNVFRSIYFANGVLNKAAFRYYAFYDSNYKFVAATKQAVDQTEVTVPSGVSYVRFTINKIFIDTNTFMITNNTSSVSSYSANKEAIKSISMPTINHSSNVKIIDINGGGDFKSINEAFNSIADDTTSNPYTFILMPGVYKEVVKFYGNRHISIIGVNKKDCIIMTTTGVYADSPLMISGDIYVANISVIAKHPNPASLAGKGQTAYAVHTDSPGEGIATFENCFFYSNTSAALGAGGQQNQKVIFKDCEFVSETPSVISESGYGAIFVHALPSTTNNSNQAFVFINCIARSTNAKVLYLSDVNGSSDINISFYNDMFWSSVNGKQDAAIETHGTKVHITEDSYGNNIAKLNK